MFLGLEVEIQIYHICTWAWVEAALGSAGLLRIQALVLCDVERVAHAEGKTSAQTLILLGLEEVLETVAQRDVVTLDV